MYWSGPIILGFVIYHLLDFTFGTVNPNFQEGRVHDNVVASFQLIPVSAFYIFAMLLLCMHLYHGLWSMFQSLGMNHPRYTPILKRCAAAIAILIAAGNISIPLSVMAGAGDYPIELHTRVRFRPVQRPARHGRLLLETAVQS